MGDPAPIRVEDFDLAVAARYPDVVNCPRTGDDGSLFESVSKGASAVNLTSDFADKSVKFAQKHSIAPRHRIEQEVSIENVQK
jgi:hypothetical protein